MDPTDFLSNPGPDDPATDRMARRLGAVVCAACLSSALLMTTLAAALIGGVA